MPELICVDHELDDELPTVGALIIYNGNSLCEEHFEKRIEANREAERRFERQLAEIKGEGRDEHAV
jgi:hypothetical protein